MCRVMTVLLRCAYSLERTAKHVPIRPAVRFTDNVNSIVLAPKRRAASRHDDGDHRTGGNGLADLEAPLGADDANPSGINRRGKAINLSTSRYWVCMGGSSLPLGL